MRKTLHDIFRLSLMLCFLGTTVQAQVANRWQQRAEYQMEIDMDVEKHQFAGKQKLTYYNNSPDTLNQIFYHLYFNAFQPGSMMDVRSRTIEDPDGRVRDRIFKLKPNEIGFQKILSLKQDGKAVQYEVAGSILEVQLNRPIVPGKKTVFDMEFQGQVPVQIRRSGRNNAEGVDYSMSQWYPKLCEYDYKGWHSNPYIGREFHGVWGDFDVKISIDSSYIIGATGYLQNPEQIGHGYLKAGQTLKRPKSEKLTWHFKATNVHDFVWAADPDYAHDIAQVPDGPELHFFYIKGRSAAKKNWEELPKYTIDAFQFMSKTFGKYPYSKYSVIQGGDGGMEYPMATLILGDISLGGLVGVTVHELIHSWYQGVLANNESLSAWMDEGFNTYAGNTFRAKGFNSEKNIHAGSYGSYFSIVKREIEEPLSTHADHFEYNSAYSMAAYSKGCVFLAQLGYVVGEETMARSMLRYFNTWKFKHPNANDFIRIVEKESGLELDWYIEYFVNTTYTIDYGVRYIESEGNKTYVTLEKIGRMPMPLDILVTYKDGSQELFYVPMRLMRGEKPHELSDVKRTIKPDWPWTNPTYRMEIPRSNAEIEKIEIDPSKRMADIERANNVFPARDNVTYEDQK